MIENETKMETTGSDVLDPTLVPEKVPKPLPMHTIAIGLAVLVVVAGGALGYLYNEYATLTSDPNAQNQQKIEQVVAKVSKLIEVPENEVPTLASITDAESLKDQPFFQNAEVGDQVLLYQVARKAYLYRPSKNLMVEVASLDTSQ